MRNAWTIVLLGLLFGLVLVTFITGDLFLIFLAVTCFLMVAVGGYMNLLMQKHSPHLVGPGFITSIVSTNPLNRVKLEGEGKNTKDTELDIFGCGGMAEFGMVGGGKHGYAVVRRDLMTPMPGDDSAIWVSSAPPDLFAPCPAQGSGYKDIEMLDPVLKAALRNTKHWHPTKSKVVVFWDHPKKNPRSDDEIDKKTGMPYKVLYERANLRIKALEDVNNGLMTGMTNIADTHANVLRSYGRRTAEDEHEEDA